ncbi:type II toxin-antitoxin system PemK/MazF family toxin [Tessaracoccus sp. MC1627]|uniref:type II toxin-antitoxin system PemK/MazF family toxin n=1 Tax=Tessaracoccus sp. MC1627 TaxID=2760312 RepID=UPI001C721A3D
MTQFPARGDVWWCEMPEIGRRPVVILSRDAVIPRHRRALIAPCTTTIRNLPSEVLLEPGETRCRCARRSTWTLSRAPR